MKILYLNLGGEMGGAERSLLDLIASTRQTIPYARMLLLASADGPLVRLAREAGAEARALPMPSALAGMGDSALARGGRAASAARILARAAPAAFAASRYAAKLRRAAAGFEPDIVHSNGNKMHLAAAVARVRGAALVWHVRDFIGARRLLPMALRRLRRRATGVIAISEAVAADARAVLPGLPVQVVYNAIDVDHFAPGGPAAALDTLAGLAPLGADGIRVGLVATYATWKGHDLFLEAAARALASLRGQRVRFYVVGGPIYATPGSQVSAVELRKKAASLRLSDRVAFIGFQNDPAPVYRALDVFVHASTRPEPFGRTIVEAMGCGRAVIASRAGGAAELFTHDSDAIGFTPGSVGELADAIVFLVNNDQRRALLGERARRTAVERFSRARLGPEVVEAYERFRSERAA
jgi:glycosyltransferase involved in cell wall biosynthesis